MKTEFISKVYKGLVFLTFLLPVGFSNNMIVKVPNPQDSQQVVDSVLRNLPAINIDYISVIQGEKYTLPLCTYFFENIGEIPNFSESVCNAIIPSQNNFKSLFHYSFQMLSSSAGGFGPPLPGIAQSKIINDESDLNCIFETLGVELTQTEEWNKLPFNFRIGMVEILYSIHEAKTIFDQFSTPIKACLAEDYLSTEKIYGELIVPWNDRELKEFKSIELIELADLKKLSFATRIFVEKLNWFYSQKEIKVPEDFKQCFIKTDLGGLLISGCGNDTIEGGQFFIVELGGDDVYKGTTASSLSGDQPFGLVVDLQGNDKYLCDDDFLAAGILGIAVLLDLAGDDLYQTNRPGLGFALYGSSLLYDYSGHDVYIGNSKYGQAASFVGSSLFVDISGDDIYNCQSFSQAFGGTLGVGIFLDNSGDDHYNSSETDGIENNYLPGFIQGASRGRWAEASDGQSLAGGIGIFVDNGGIDKYVAGSFSQGASYYFGLGLFNDNEGDDSYDAVSHSQGYAAHYSLSGFFDRKGDDTYNPESDKYKITQIIGGGRDFSAGLFIECEGNDTYYFGNRSAGIGDISGVGLLADYYGNDKYVWYKNGVNSNSSSLGKEVGLGSGMNMGVKFFQPKNIVHKGLFIDNNGVNKFEER